jgi:hypothetical protein
MSRKPESQLLAIIKDARQDADYWRRQLRKATDPISKATYQRGVDRAEAQMKRAKWRNRKK